MREMNQSFLRNFKPVSSGKSLSFGRTLSLHKTVSFTKTVSVGLFLFLFSLVIFSCKREATQWQVYDYPEMNGTAYISFNKNKVKGIICADVQGIQGRMNISHEATIEQFENLKEKFEEYGATYKGLTETPDIKDYPDLSAYLTFVLSDDELHELWRNLGLEE